MPKIVANCRINVENPNHIRNFIFGKGLTKEQVLEAIKVVGNKISDLEQHFNIHKNPYLHRVPRGRWRL